MVFGQANLARGILASALLSLLLVYHLGIYRVPIFDSITILGLILPYNSELTLVPQAILLTGQAKLEDGKSLSSVFDLPYEWPQMESSLGESEDVEC